MKTILFISHDGNRAGAQLFLYNIMLALKAEGYQILLLIINDHGDLRESFNTNFKTYYLNKSTQKNKLNRIFVPRENTLNTIQKHHKIDLIYANTIVATEILDQIKFKIKAPIVSHIHELSYSIHQFGSEKALSNLFEFSDEIIACSIAVAENLKNINTTETKITVVHSFVNNNEVLSTQEIGSQKSEVSGSEDFMVGACGNVDWRKAPDIFLLIAKNVLKKDLNFKFVWIGIDKKDPLFEQLTYDAKKLGIEEQIIWIEKTPKSVQIINALDIFLVCSREDPFPLVMLEAALCQKPIVGFKNTGGAEEFIEEDAGLLSPYLDIEDMAKQILRLKNSPELIKFYGENAKNKTEKIYNFEQSLLKIKNIINENLK